MTASAVARPLHGSQVLAADFPEGVFRVPVELVLNRSASASAYLVLSRSRMGDRPLQNATVFLHLGEAFAIVDYPDQAHASLMFATSFAPAELADMAATKPFGRRGAAR